MGKYISQSVIRRLPKYYRYLRDLEKYGVDRVSSSMLANALGFTASQVRQDFSCFGGFGQQGYGYKVSSLLEELAGIIGINRRHTAAIIGVGNLGRALMHNFHFDHCGFELIAAFDADKELVGKKFGDITVLDVSSIEEYFAENHVDVAVLTVPKEYVRDVAKRVAKLGISGIWNFTHIDLSLEELGVLVENVHFAESLLTLCYGISLGEKV
jgi:redox-sensing transcriptional repressor